MISLPPFDGPVRRREGLPRPKIAGAARPGKGPGVRGVGSPQGRELTELFAATCGVDFGTPNLGDFLPLPDDLVRPPKGRNRSEIAVGARPRVGRGDGGVRSSLDLKIGGV